MPDINFSLTRSCPSCSKLNRVPVRHLIQEARVPVLVDFWAAWCGPCRAAAPEVKALAKEMAGSALILKVDTEGSPDLAGRFRIQSIPNFMVFVNGKPVHQQAGLAPRAVMRSWIERAYGS